MRDNFAVFILTHGRASNVVTLKTLKRQGYSGRWYIIIDNEDETADEYRKNFGDDHVIMFDKAAAVARADTMDNLNEHRAILYARNESFRIAKELGLKYFLMLDDDYTTIMYRYIDGGKLRGIELKGKALDGLFEAMLTFLDTSGAAIVALAQGGDMIGGAQSPRFRAGIIRKCMNSMFCRTDRPIEFRGTMNEDITTYTTLGSRGVLFMTFTACQIIQIQTQTLKGGMTDAYKESGTYLKSFYSVLSMPSAVKIYMMYSKYNRIHSRVDWDLCVPKIMNEKYRKERNDDEHHGK